MQRQFDVVIQRDEEGYYIASVPQLPGCHTQARSLDEVMERARLFSFVSRSKGRRPRRLNSSGFNELSSPHEPQARGPPAPH